MIDESHCCFCDQEGHFTYKCNSVNAVELKQEIKNLTTNMLTDRYRNIDRIAPCDPCNNALFDRLMMLTKIEITVILGDEYMQLPKKQLIAMYITDTITEMHEFHTQGQQINRVYPFRKLHIMMAEIIYWDNIANGNPDDTSKRELLSEISRYVIKQHNSHVFPINTYLQLYNYDNTKNTWDYAYQLPELNDRVIDCPVCIDSKPSTQCVSLNCSHKFCGNCFEEILKKCSKEFHKTDVSPSCPLCRADVLYICSPDKTMLDFHIRKYCNSNPYIIKMIDTK